MSFVEENKNWLIALGVVAGVSYFGGGAATAHRHKGAITAEKLRFNEHWKVLMVSFNDFKRATKALTRSRGRGWFKGKLLGSEQERAEEQKIERQYLATAVHRIRAFEDAWSGPERRRFEKFKRNLRKVSQNAYNEIFGGEEE